EYMEGDVKKKGFKYTLYGIGFVIAYERVAENYIEEPNETKWVSKAGHRHAVRVHDTGLDVVPATVIGYIGDLRTDEVTYVNPFHAAISYFKKIVRRISE